jgi:hypothetical protein
MGVNRDETLSLPKSAFGKISPERVSPGNVPWALHHGTG